MKAICMFLGAGHLVLTLLGLLEVLDYRICIKPVGGCIKEAK